MSETRLRIAGKKWQRRAGACPQCGVKHLIVLVMWEGKKLFATCSHCHIQAELLCVPKKPSP